MFDEDVIRMWKRADASAVTWSRGTVESLLFPAARRAGLALEHAVWSQVAMLAATVGCAAFNLYGYRGNATMLAVEFALALVSAGCAVLGARLALSLRRAGRADQPLLETLQRKLALYERWYGPWLFVAAATPWLFSLALNTWIDNEQGAYRIHHPYEFGAVSAAMLGITYGMLRVSLAPIERELRAVLDDLREDALLATERIRPAQRRSRLWLALGVLALAGAVLASIWLWLSREAA
ncbi:MAG: hypothetical protein IT453_05320 [Planctomycetes bacterium]|nr:hypothetical protein [Planctomycetota bacterium]